MLVKVWNDNTYDFKEPNFKGNVVLVKAGGFIEMDLEEAVEFQGQYSPLPPEDTQPDDQVKYFKKIRIERPPQATMTVATEYVCQLTGKKFGILEDYKKHIVASAELYAGSLVVDEVAEAEISAKRKRA